MTHRFVPALVLYSALYSSLTPTAIGHEIIVAPHDASAKVKATAGFVCSGDHDEVEINQAIECLSSLFEETVQLRSLVAVDPDGPRIWRPIPEDVKVERKTIDGAHVGLHIVGSTSAYPGIEFANLNLDVSSYEALEIRLHSDAAIKLRVILRDSRNQEVRYHEKLPQPGSLHGVRFFLNQPYRGTADLSKIVSVKIQATTDLDHCDFSVLRAAFFTTADLAHDRVHPDTIMVSRNGSELLPATDINVDHKLGRIWSASENTTSARVRYRHGGGTVRLLPGHYQIDGPRGIILSSYCNLKLDDAILIASESYDAPGQLIQSAPSRSHTSITITGGHLRGHRMLWSPETNVGGVILRDTSHVLIEGCEIVDFNSAGIAVIHTPGNGVPMPPPQQIAVIRNRIARCATEYVDIRGDKYGEVGKGSDHKAMLRLAGVRGFQICDNRLEDSYGDAKWVFGCQDGMIRGNAIENSRMGSYFVERSVRVIGSGNVIRNAGSRAVTIERGSHENIFANNVIVNSYREGLWLMGCSECLIQGNRFENCGWRNSEGVDSSIKIDWQEKFAHDMSHSNLVMTNLIKAQPHQDQAIWITSGHNSRGNVISDNVILGAAQAIRDDGVDTVLTNNRRQ